MILDKLAASTKKRIAKAKEQISLEEMIGAASPCPHPFSFEEALKEPEMSFICEVKKASPSKGIIAPDFPYLSIAKEYEEAGANAVSVLTEPEYFLGSDHFLKEISQEIKLPTLRKDFILDPYQIYEARVLGASAVLLICSLLDTKTLTQYIKICDRLGLSALVEAHDESEIYSALEAHARIIGVNNRNLKTFEVDFNNSIHLRTLVPPSVIFVAESGIHSAQHISLLHQAGVNAVLVGESLMRSPDKSQILHQWRSVL